MDLAQTIFRLARPGEHDLWDARANLEALNLDLNVDRALNEVRFFRFYVVHLAIQMTLPGSPKAKMLRMAYADRLYRAEGENRMLLHRLKGYETVVKLKRKHGIFEQFSIHCLDRMDPALVDFAMGVTDDLVGKTEALIRYVNEQAERDLQTE